MGVYVAGRRTTDDEGIAEMMNGDNTPDGWTPFDDIVAGVDEDTAHGG